MKYKSIYKKSLAADVLLMVAAGPIILASLFLPNAPQMLKPLLKLHRNWNKIKRQRIYEAIGRLNKKRLVELDQRGNELYLKITENGKKLIKNFDYDNIELSYDKKWDKKWRMVVFDIPEKKSKERRAFSTKLKGLGFYPLQESVFIYPYDCQNEIDFICNFLSIDNYVNYCTLETLDKKEGDLRKFFDLSLRL
ncbi:MAG: Transcriptional regulator, PaaX family [Candidatus Azambacteria bacterium GW2011_GWA2_39_10]|uniref:Transcriptional regulator, PaaX family n=1 Tax=Candidatus Azambacteria bacterium GW2011_GWA2_39_10 TaxID=1618611 RepID=A0A0G0LHP7_9BACT|nr:MAG: Transcriptional regulator, PaaX family [Candidatus Azambacteria bacterium GW2011_GWA2_39_10]